MIGNMKKIGTLLVTLAFFGSVLLVSMPVEAAGVKDVYVVGITVSDATPTIGDNITITAQIQTKNVSVSDLDVSFEASNGTNTLALETIHVVGPVVNATPTAVVGYWNSTDLMSWLFLDPALKYNITVTVTVTGDANLTNNTMVKVGAVDWKASLMQATALNGPATVVQGAPYTLSVTMKNNGDGALKFIDVFSVYDEPADDYLTTGMFEGISTPIAIGASATTTVDIDTSALAVGDHTFNVSHNGVEMAKAVKVLANVTNVSVTDITFNPTSNWKGTQTVTITASLLNDGTKDWVSKAVTFAIGDVAITTCTATVNVTANGGTNTTTCVWAIPGSTTSKTYKINVTADTNMSKNLLVLPSPHWTLGIAGIAITPQTLVAKENVGDTQDITITTTVTNTGDLNAVNAIFKLMAGNEIIYTNNTVNVTAGGQIPVTFVYPIATAENDKLVNITANITLGTSTFETIKNVTVPGDLDHPDYAFVDLSVAPTVSQERGLKTTITVSVKNTGDLIGTTITLKFKAGTSDIGSKTLVNLTVGGTGNTTTLDWTIPSTFALGKVDINVTIDGYTTVAGLTVFKNMSYTIIELKKPSVAVDFAKDTKGKIKSYSSSGASGSTKTLKVVVNLKNSGNADAKNLKIVIKDSKGKELANMTGITVAAGASVNETLEIKLKAGTSTKLTADITYDGIHGLAGIDKGLTATSPTADSPSAKVVKTPGFEGVLLVGAVAIALVVLSRRKKN